MQGLIWNSKDPPKTNISTIYRELPHIKEIDYSIQPNLAAKQKQYKDYGIMEQ